jgi:hypothetical protein
MSCQVARTCNEALDLDMYMYKVLRHPDMHPGHPGRPDLYLSTVVLTIDDETTLTSTIADSIQSMWCTSQLTPGTTIYRFSVPVDVDIDIDTYIVNESTIAKITATIGMNKPR